MYLVSEEKGYSRRFRKFLQADNGHVEGSAGPSVVRDDLAADTVYRNKNISTQTAVLKANAKRTPRIHCRQRFAEGPSLHRRQNCYRGASLR